VRREILLLNMIVILVLCLNAYAENGVTEKEILFGQSASFKGTSAALGSELWRGSEAYFRHINSRGGVHGRKIVIKALDDGYEGRETLKNTIQLTLKEKVFGLFGYVGTPTIVDALPAIQKFSEQDMFLFSNLTGAQPQREMPHVPNVFNVRSSYRQETSKIVNLFLDNGIKKVGIFIQEDAYGRSGADGVQRALQAKGLTIAGESTYIRGAKYSQSMAEQVKILKRKGVEAVVSVGSYAACAAFIRDSRKMGFDVPIANISFVGSNAVLQRLESEERKTKKPGFYTKRMLNSQVVPPWSDVTVPVVMEYRQLMDRYRPQVPSQLLDPNYNPSEYSFISLEGFINAKLLVEILKRAPKNLTRKNFKKTAHKIKNLDIGLAGVKVGFSEDDHQAMDSVFLTTVENGQYVPLVSWSQLMNSSQKVGINK